MTIMTVGIDLAKNVFSLHGVDENGKVALRRIAEYDAHVKATVQADERARKLN